MSITSAQRAALRAEVEAAALAEIERVGPEALNKNCVAKRFARRGASPATVYRWVDAMVKDGRAGQHLARKVRAAVAERAKRHPVPMDAAAHVAAEVMANLPVLVSPDDIAGCGGTISAIGQLQDCMHAARQVMKHARTTDGDVRMAKTLLTASEHLRRCLETTARLAEAMRSVAEVDRFHQAVMEEVAREAPAVTERILMRLGQATRALGA